MFIHPSSDVQATRIGCGTTIWQYCVVLAGAEIGSDCNINAHCFIEDDVVVGNRVTIKSGVYLWNGTRVEDDVFIGPNVTFTNDPHPRSKRRPAQFHGVTLKTGASVGAGAVLLPGIIVGEHAVIAAGAIVTRDVDPYVLLRGNPARPHGRVQW